MTISGTERQPDPPGAAPSAFSVMEPVGLDELDQTALLQTRVDRKYVIDLQTLDWLASELVTSARVLEIDRCRRFRYASVYHDTPDLRSYLDAARSRPSRFKVRVRSYVDTDRHFLEVKTRNRSRRTVKIRRPTGTPDHSGLDPADRAFVTEIVGDELGAARARASAEIIASLTPTLRTRFERTTLLIESTADHAAGKHPVRATIDTALGFEKLDGRRTVAADLCVVETKSPGPPSTVDRLLWSAGHRPLRFSKYGCGMALSLPHLPATKWNRVLRHHFGWQPSRAR